jgi:hypothetical protein
VRQQGRWSVTFTTQKGVRGLHLKPLGHLL